MAILESVRSTPTIILAVAAIAIGITVRVAVMIQPGTRFQSYWRQFFKARHPQKNLN
jgi:hypothetical protein